MAIVGSGPGVLDNEPGRIDAHDVVVRVNNYRICESTGYRTDVFYSFFGQSIHKTSFELINDGVKLCMCKCPDGHVIESRWHSKRRRMNGVDFRYIYRNRAGWWFCDTYIPSAEDFLETFELLNRHIPTTGFAAVLAVLSFGPKSVYLTGFDFFRSKIHNVSQPWRPRNADDPIGHEPERELAWLSTNATRYPLTFDPVLAQII